MYISNYNKTNNSLIGSVNENLAEKYLKDLGYKFIARNYKNKLGEIDLIFKDEDRIVFVEVKSKETARFGYGREMINSMKQQKLRKTVSLYLMQKGLIDSKIRFDCVEIQSGILTHLKAIF